MGDETFLKVSERVFAEADKGGNSRPFEWRKSFKTVWVNLSRPSKTLFFQTNELDWSVANEPELVKPNLKTIRGLVFEDVATDRFDRFGVFEASNSVAGAWVARSLRSKVQVTLTDRPPSEGHGSFSPGAYIGVAMPPDEYSGVDCLRIEVSVSTEQFTEISAAFDCGSINTLKAAIALEAYSSEVDDALREWDDSQELRIAGHCPATLTSAEALFVPDSESADVASAPDDASPESPISQSADTGSFESRYMLSLKRAAWIATASLVVIALKIGA